MGIKLLTEVADSLGIKRQQLINWGKRGLVTLHVDKLTGRYSVDPDEVELLLFNRYTKMEVKPKETEPKVRKKVEKKVE